MAASRKKRKKKKNADLTERSPKPSFSKSGNKNLVIYFFLIPKYVFMHFDKEIYRLHCAVI